MNYWLQDYYKDKYASELRPLSAPMRESVLFAHYIEEIPLAVREDDCFAGRYGYPDGEGPAALPHEKMPYTAVLTEEEHILRNALREKCCVEINFNAAHTCVDYGSVIAYGLVRYLEKAEALSEKEPENEMLRAMRNSLLACGTFATRFADIASEQAAKAGSPDARKRLLHIADMLHTVPMQPARDIFDAIQCLWLMHSLIPIAEKSWASISIGRIDQFLLPLYRKAKRDGISDAEIRPYFVQLFRMLDTYGDGACAMNLGGASAEGNGGVNELTRLLLSVEKELMLRAPIIAVRVSPETPEDFLDELIDFRLFCNGQPTFYGENPCRCAVAGRGIPEDEAARFSVNSCMGLYLSGREYADMWGVKMNAHLPLELAVTGGHPFRDTEIPGFHRETKEPADFDALLSRYESYLSETLSHAARLYRAVAEEAAANSPDPLLSALTAGCMERGLDRAVGAEYNTVTVEMMGFINTCDALEAVKELVYEQKKYTLKELCDAASANYEGYEPLRQDILGCAKYGMNDPSVNEICRRLSLSAAAVCRKLSKEHFLFLPSLHTIDANVWYGQGLYATLDGRLAGTPVNRNADPSSLLTELVPTSQILSAVSVAQTDFSGGQPIDLYFDASWFAEKEKRDKIKQLILTYFKLGGLQLQVNSVDLALLEKANEHPEEYPQVIIRKGGYSVYFRELSRAARDNFISYVKETHA